MRPAASLALLALPLLLAGCKAETAGERNSLRVADQFGRLGMILSAAGEAKPGAYKLEWSNFVGGPAIIAAQTGGSVDVGWMAETPMIFAQAAGTPVKIIAVARPHGGARSGRYALAVRNGSPITSVRDLRGKKVAYLPGTVVQYVLVQWLGANGLALGDIQPTALQGGIGAPATLLDSGQVDAVVTGDPMWASLETAGKIRVIATSAPPFKSGFNFLIAPAKLLQDKSAEPLLRDFIQRNVRAARWQIANPGPAAHAIAATYHVPQELGPKILERSQLEWVPIDDTVVAEQQAEADLFHKLGFIRQKLDVRESFDPRFNALIAETAKSAPARETVQ